MLGIFDSGVGGMLSFSEVRRALSRENIVYLADRKNAPYGTKTKEELISLVSRDIKRLRAYGCNKILIACCTASTVYPHLSSAERKISMPIILPVARAAASGKRISVIATRHTVAVSAFSHAISEISPDSEVFEAETGELVTLTEDGGRDGALTDKQMATVKNITEKIKANNPDTLILGCTHFCHLEKTFGELLPKVKIVSSAREGAMSLINTARQKSENGKICYTE